MQYAVLQTDLNPPPVDLLKRAFRKVQFLTDLDAHTLHNDAFGILAERLTPDRASDLQGALRLEGIDTELVPMQLLPQLPPTKFLNRLDVGSQALVIYDPIGRPFQIDWSQVLMVAAGRVRVNEFRTHKTRVPSRYQDGGGMAYQSYTVESHTKEERNERGLMEIVLGRGTLRYSMTEESFNYTYLGTRLQELPEENFVLLVRDILAQTPHAVLNRGAYYLRERAGQPFTYPSKKAFFEELTWLLWRAKVQNPAP